MNRTWLQGIFLIISFIFMAVQANAETCNSPSRPFVPGNPDDVREYSDLIRRDFEAYISDVQGYMRCLDAERQRAFGEAQEVTQDYGRFIEIVQQ